MNLKYHVLIPTFCAALISILLFSIFGNSLITTVMMSAPISDRKVIIIDAGHGGEDGGATSCTGVLESNLNLEISLRLRDLMELLGCKTILLRDSDDALHTDGQTIAARKISDLKQRVHIINETDNAVLISIHQNHFSDSRYAGTQVFYAPTAESKMLAQNIQTATKETLQPNNTRQIKAADGIYLMQHIQTPGVLVECGFISNPAEEANLRDSEYQMKLCCVIASSCSRFLHEQDGAT